MRQRLYRGHTHECGKVQVDGAELNPVALEIGSGRLAAISAQVAEIAQAVRR